MDWPLARRPEMMDPAELVPFVGPRHGEALLPCRRAAIPPMHAAGERAGELEDAAADEDAGVVAWTQRWSVEMLKSTKQVGAEQRCVVVEREETPSPLRRHLDERRRAILSRRAIISGRRANGQCAPVMMFPPALGER